MGNDGTVREADFCSGFCILGDHPGGGRLGKRRQEPVVYVQAGIQTPSVAEPPAEAEFGGAGYIEQFGFELALGGDPGQCQVFRRPARNSCTGVGGRSGDVFPLVIVNAPDRVQEIIVLAVIQLLLFTGIGRSLPRVIIDEPGHRVIRVTVEPAQRNTSETPEHPAIIRRTLVTFETAVIVASDVEKETGTQSEVEVVGFLLVERSHELGHQGNLDRIKGLVFLQGDEFVGIRDGVIRGILFYIGYAQRHDVGLFLDSSGCRAFIAGKKEPGIVGGGEGASVDGELRTRCQAPVLVEVEGVSEAGATAETVGKQGICRIWSEIAVNLIVQGRQAAEDIDVELMLRNPFGTPGLRHRCQGHQGRGKNQ